MFEGLPCCLLVCCGQEDKSRCFSIHTASLEGKPQPLTALSTITCCYSHTQELSILSSVSLHTHSHRSSYPSIYKNKTKQCTSPLGMCPFRSTFPFVSGRFYPFIYWPSFAALTTTLVSVSLFHSTLREGVCVNTKQKVSRGTTLNSIFFLSLTIEGMHVMPLYSATSDTV